jgi:hypothetical protein
MRSIASLSAVAAALFLTQTTFALAQLSPSTPGGLGGTTLGTVPGTTIGVAPPPAFVPPTANPNQVPAGATLHSTTPPPSNLGPGITSSSGGPGSATVGRSARPNKNERREDALIEAGEREVDRRIQNICRGC